MNHSFQQTDASQSDWLFCRGLQSIRRLILYALLLDVMTALPGAPTNAHGAEGIKRSDVAFAYQASPEVYRQYGATLVAWGFRPWKLSGEPFFAEWKRGVDQAHSVGARYQARVEMDAGWRGMIDFDPNFREAACIDLDGEPITYRFWHSQHKGHPPYYFCSHAPGFRAYLIHQAKEALAVNPDMLLIDGIHTTAQWSDVGPGTLATNTQGPALVLGSSRKRGRCPCPLKP